MDKNKTISGFSKLSKRGKIKWMVENFFKDPEHVMRTLTSYWHQNEDQQKILDGFSENTISNFPMPYGVAPNFMIDGQAYCVPMVIEESSVVAAASAAAKFWMSRGGFKTEILGTQKIGQVHFLWRGDFADIKAQEKKIEQLIRTACSDITTNMEKRGGGISKMEVLDFSSEKTDYRQLKIYFETCDSMGANFINSVLERSAGVLKKFALSNTDFTGDEKNLEIIMSILSNYTPDCIVRTSVSCPTDQLSSSTSQMSGQEFAEKFKTAIDIAIIDPYRATTHNKGIFNGIDAVVLATGNDFRAIEACGHTYAARDGQYRSLSKCDIRDGIFHFWMDLPLAVGTVGGLTNLHPIAKTSLELLGNPSAEELMKIIATTGLAQNFAAIRSLITTGIQKGHMKMHLLNILNHLQASEIESNESIEFFKNKEISFSKVRDFVLSIRQSDKARPIST